MTKTAAIYARISKDDQSIYSIDTQLDACREYATKRLNAVVVGDPYVDGFTGTSLARPALDRLVALAGKVDYIVAYVQDRLSRADELDTWNLFRSIQDKGPEIHCVDIGFVDTTDFIKWLEMLFRAREAKNEHAKIVERSTRANRARAKSGKVTMPIAKYGYDYAQGTPPGKCG